jgi:5-methyltetrahydrofolate--homocysteine methyltransferase
MRSPEEILREIAENLASLDADKLRKSIDAALENGVDPAEIVREGLGRGMEIVGQRYEKGDYFLSELIVAGATMKDALEVIQPHLRRGETRPLASVVVGTVEGDLHDIGKNLVKTMLESAGFQVHDLGVDVAPSTFVKACRELRPKIVGLSALLTVTAPKVQETVEALEASSLRGSLKILVGGRCLSEEMARQIRADAYGRDAWDAVQKAKQLLST